MHTRIHAYTHTHEDGNTETLAHWQKLTSKTAKQKPQSEKHKNTEKWQYIYIIIKTQLDF